MSDEPKIYIRSMLLPRSCRAPAALLPRSCRAPAALLPRSCRAPAALLPRFLDVLSAEQMREFGILAALLSRFFRLSRVRRFQASWLELFPDPAPKVLPNYPAPAQTSSLSLIAIPLTRIKSH